MKIKFICILLIILQYGSCILDMKRCTNSQETLLSLPPQPTMKFYLFTNSNFYIEQQIYIGSKSALENSNFNSNWPVRIIVHGWKNYFKSCVNGYIKDAYLKKGDFNVIVVDWSDWAKQTNYHTIVPHVFDTVGPLLAKFILFLYGSSNVQFDQIYLIGHDIGAHVAGAAGYNIQPYIINTIFGLDPAGTGFQGNTPNKRLDKNQANYVEQISTNMGEFGYVGKIGDAAFYPNYGRIQNYCFKQRGTTRFCNHFTSFRYFAETINSEKGFCASECSYHLSVNESIKLAVGCDNVKLKCNPKILMGGEPSIPKRGNYYLRTNDAPPFAICDC